MTLRRYFWLLAAGPLFGQATGTIAGTVRDASGAVVPAAQVTATNTGTNLARSGESDSWGQFVFPVMPLGAYEVRVEKQGFTAFLQKGITLQANTQVSVDAVLQVSSASTQLTVSSEASLVQTTSSTLVQVVDSQRVADLPLNGRNVLQLVSLNAGVADRGVPSTVQGSNLGMGAYQPVVSMNGARGNSTNYLLDNADHNEAQTNMSRAYPNVDAVQEFSVQTSSFDAQYGRAVGGVVNVVTKSGSNEFHGAVFHFLRNYKLNAANFFSGLDSVKRNQFGAALGGPVLRDRTFFFASYQGTRIRTATPGALRTSPTEAMKSGDFSAWTGGIRDPKAMDTYFPNNQIPRSRFDPVAVKVLQLIPSSPGAPYQIRFGTPASFTNDEQGVFRGDHQLTVKQRLSARYFAMHYDNRPELLKNNLLYATDGQIGTEHSIGVNHTHSISPHWLNNLNVSYVFCDPVRLTASEPNVSLETLGARVKNAPGVNLLGLSFSGWSGISLGNYGVNTTKSFQAADTAGYATGRHNLRFGGELRRYRTGFQSYYLTGGTVSFTGQLLSDRGRQTAGHSYAEFLLGVAASWRQLSVSWLGIRNDLYSLFFQDDVRVTRKLTLNLGLRFDPKLGVGESKNQHTTFMAGEQSTAFPRAPRGLLFYGDAKVGSTAIPSDWNNLAPRVGLAYEILPRTVVRAAYGWFFDEYMGLIYNRTIQGQPWVADATLTGPLSLSDPYGGGPLVEPLTYKADPNTSFWDYSTYAVPTKDMRAGYVQNWNFVLERELPGLLLVRAAYVGSKGTHLLNSVESNPGIYAPGATASNVNQRRPYARIGPLALGLSNANSSYNSFQLTVQRRLRGGFSVLANYTIAKSLDYLSYTAVSGNSAGPDPFNLRNNYGPSDFDVAQRLVVSGTWELPRLERAQPVLRGVLGGWQSNFIFTASTGLPLTVTSGVDNDYNGVSGDFADYLGGQWQLPGNRSKSEKIARWFNTSVFARNQIGTIGSARRGQLRNPGVWGVDYSVFKSFQLWERARLQARGEFFNLLNHANLGGPTSSVNSTTFGMISGAGSPRIVQLALKVIF